MVEKLETINGSDLIDARLPKKEVLCRGLNPTRAYSIGWST